MQNTIVEFLIWHQCRVLSTSQHPRKTTCHKCGAQFHPSESLTTSPGLPDLLVRMNHWPAILGFPVGIEVKRDAKSPVRPMQREFAELGFATICWTPEQAWEAVQRVDRLIQGIEG